MTTGDPNHSLHSLRKPGWAVAGAIVLVPLVSYHQLVDATLLPRAILLAVLIFLLMLSLFRNPGVKGLATLAYPWQLLIPFMLLVVAYALSSLNALNMVEARFWIHKHLLFLLLAGALLASIRLQRVNLTIVSAGVTLSVVLALALLIKELYAFDFTSNTWHDLRTPFGHKNLHAAWLVLALPFMLHLAKNTRKGFIMMLVVVICCAVPLLIIMLQARAAAIALLVMALFYGMHALSKNRRRLKMALVVSTAVVIIAVVTVIMLPAGVLGQLDSGSFAERLIVWDNTWQMIGEHLWSGVGGGNWQIHFPKYGLHHFHELNQRVYQGYETFQRPHNDYLWVWAEAGITGLLAWLLIPVLNLWFFLQRGYWKREVFNSRVLMTGGVLAFFVIAIADFPSERFEMMLLMVLCYLFAVAPDADPAPSSGKSRNIKPLLASALVLTVYLGYSVYLRAASEHNHYQVLEAHSSGDWLRMSRLTESTNQRVYNTDNFSIPVQWYAGVALSALGQTHEAHLRFKQALAVNPWQVHVLNNLAGTYQQLGEPHRALDYYRQALEMAPLHYDVLLNKSITLYQTENIEEAFHTLLDLVYKKEHPAAYHHAMPVIFDAYLNKLLIHDKSGRWNHQSLRKLNQSDSLKIVVLYHHQIEGVELEDLLNGF